MNDLGEDAGCAFLCFLVGCLAAPLAQELSVFVEHHDAAVAVAVGDIDVAVGRIDHDRRRHVQLILGSVEANTLSRTIDGIELAADADLQQQFPVR